MGRTTTRGVSARNALLAALGTAATIGALAAPNAPAADVGSAGLLAPVGTGEGQLQLPDGVETHTAPDGSAQWVWAADTGNKRVQAFDAATLAHRRTVGGPMKGQIPALGELIQPEDVAVTGDGDQQRVFVVDTKAHQVQRFRPDGLAELAFGELGNQEGQFLTPVSVAVGPQTGYVYVLDRTLSRVTAFQPDGTLATSWGQVGDAITQLNEPRDIVVRPAGPGDPPGTEVMWIADTGNHRVVRAVLTEGSLKEDPVILSTPFDTPQGLTAVTEGVLVSNAGLSRIDWVAESGSVIRSFGALGSGLGDLWGPSDLATAKLEVPVPCGSKTVERVFVTEAVNERTQVLDRTLIAPSCPAPPPVDPPPAPTDTGGTSTGGGTSTSTTSVTGSTTGTSSTTSTTSTPSAVSADRSAPIISSVSLRLDRTAHAIRLRLRLSEKGSLTVAASRSGRTMARRTVTVKAGLSSIVVRPAKAKWRALSRKGTIAIKLTAKDAAGNANTVRRNLRVR